MNHRLDQKRIANLSGGCGNPVQGCVFGKGLDGARHDRNTRGGGDRPRASLSAHAADRVSWRSDERQAGGRAAVGEACILGEEPITGMDEPGATPVRRDGRAKTLLLELP